VVNERERILERLRELIAAADEIEDPTLRAAMRALLRDAPASPAGDDAWHGMIGTSPGMLEVRALIEKFAPANAPVLIQGESGTGKDVAARLLHGLGPRRAGPFVAENCAAIPETLLESLLFGHKRGAFTGAVRDHPGHFVAADKGTLFLDEIGDMALSMQAKLLRTLQESEVRPVGGDRVVKVDVRVIAASNQDLARLVSESRFRQDLFYRLNVLQLTMPPLRERGDDILVLARHFLRNAAAGRELQLGDDACAALRAARWPGNVRQLQNEMQRVAALADGPVIGRADLSADLE
jgi:transcriptional regulator with GAF, ATPase, and Fis domain